MLNPVTDRFRLPPGLLRPMRLRPAEDDGGERHATWFELFFDLVFVVAVAGQASGLAADSSLHGFVRFVLLFLPIWWAWILYTFFSDRFDTDDVACRLLGMVGMLAIVAMGVNVRRAMTDGAAGHDAPFAVSYLAARWVCAVLYIRAGHSLEIGRRLARIHVTTSVLTSCIWLGALLAPEPWRYVVWAGAIAFELAVPMVISRRTIATVPVTRDHITERFGLFTLIVLGEAVVAVATGIDDAAWSVRGTIAAICAFVLACCLWWLHFDYANSEPPTRSFAARQVYVFGHFVTVASLTAVAAGALLAIEHAADGHLAAGARWALGGGLAVYLLATIGIRLAVLEPPRLRQLPRFWLLWSVIAVALAVAALGGPLPPLAAMGAIAATMTWMIARKVVLHAIKRAGYPDAVAPSPAETSTGEPVTAYWSR